MLSSNVIVPMWLRMCIIVWFALAPKSNKQLGRVEHIPCNFNNNTIISLTNSKLFLEYKVHYVYAQFLFK
jgi:hypothetical protein